MKEKTIPRATIGRLPLYYKALQFLDNEDVVTTSAMEIATILNVTPETIRKDLNFFGHFGIKGEGYDVINLKNQIANILGLQNYWRLAIIGIGNLGAALANYEKISDWGFIIAALFDIDEKKIGNEINGVRIYDFSKFVPISHRKLIDIGVITVPDDTAQFVAATLIKAGIKGIWNFTATKIEVPQDFIVVNENLMTGLSALSFYLNRNSH